MNRKDFILILLALLFAAGTFLVLNHREHGADTVIITVDGNRFCELPLSADREIPINGTNTAVIENGTVYMKSANCPDKLCIHQGKISDSSKKIICLPNKVVIEVTKQSEADTVVR